MSLKLKGDKKMIHKIKELIGKIMPSGEYISYERYADRVRFLSEFQFQQSVRRENIANSDIIGVL